LAVREEKGTGENNLSVLIIRIIMRKQERRKKRKVAKGGRFKRRTPLEKGLDWHQLMNRLSKPV